MCDTVVLPAAVDVVAVVVIVVAVNGGWRWRELLTKNASSFVSSCGFLCVSYFNRVLRIPCGFLFVGLSL